jgi:hypothetical protein
LEILWSLVLGCWSFFKTLFASPPNLVSSTSVNVSTRLRKCGSFRRRVGGRVCRVARPSRWIFPPGNRAQRGLLPVQKFPRLKNLIRKIRRQETGFFIPDFLRSSLKQFYLIESAGTIFTLVSVILFTGRSPGCVGVVAIFSSTSSPLMSFPNAVY